MVESGICGTCMLLWLLAEYELRPGLPRCGLLNIPYGRLEWSMRQLYCPDMEA